ncbi:MAG: ATP-binding protein [Rhodothermales bacterium]
MPATLAERFLSAAHRQFVGREAPLAAFTAALDADEAEHAIFYIYGPGGVGKTTLVQEYRYQCHIRGIQTVQVDGRNVEGNKEAFLASVGASLGIGDASAVLLALQQRTEPLVCLIDTYEAMTSLDAWLCRSFVPQVSAAVLFVFAGRHPLSAQWRAIPGWNQLICTVPLRYFSREESRAFLAQTDVAEASYEELVASTHGHPLALALVASVAAQRPGETVRLQQHPDIIKTLLDRLVMEVPSPAHRAALEASSLVQYLTEPLLATLLETENARPLFEWVQALSFVESSRLGLLLHDVARKVLSEELRWRNPAWWTTLHQRARRFYGNGFRTSAGRAQRDILADYVYMHRHNPTVGAIYDQLNQTDGSDNLRMGYLVADEDRAAILAAVQQHEGDTAAQWAERWIDWNPDVVQTICSANDELLGFLFTLPLDALPADLRRADPATSAAWTYLEHHEPLREGERALLFRFWMATETYQNISYPQGLIFICSVQHYLTTPHLAFSFFPCAQPDAWAPLFGYAHLKRLPEADFETDGTTFGTFGHDWRATPPLAWLDKMAARELGTSPQQQQVAASLPVLVLSEDEFAAAVKSALRDFASPLELEKNPLLQSCLVSSQHSARTALDERLPTLRSVLQEAARRLEGHPKRYAWYHALDRAYFHPVGSQEQAAEHLGVPYSTFRRHLKRGEEAVIAALWHDEVG